MINFALYFKFFLLLNPYTMDRNANEMKMTSGDCFYYKSNDDKLSIGFVLLDKKNSSSSEDASLEFALVELKGNKSIESFINGDVYTTSVWEGLDRKKSDIGIYSLSFYKESVKLLDNFVYVGNIKLDRNKFTISMGGTALFIEKAFLTQIKNTEKLIGNCKKLKLKDVLMQ